MKANEKEHFLKVRCPQNIPVFVPQDQGIKKSLCEKSQRALLRGLGTISVTSSGSGRLSKLLEGRLAASIPSKGGTGREEGSGSPAPRQRSRGSQPAAVPQPRRLPSQQQLFLCDTPSHPPGMAAKFSPSRPGDALPSSMESLSQAGGFLHCCRSGCRHCSPGTASPPPAAKARSAQVGLQTLH